MVGPITVMGTELADHAEAVITEAVSNTVRHSRASQLIIEISAADQFAISSTTARHATIGAVCG